jgi:hypothetical protein
MPKPPDAQQGHRVPTLVASIGSRSDFVSKLGEMRQMLEELGQLHAQELAEMQTRVGDKKSSLQDVVGKQVFEGAVCDGLKADTCKGEIDVCTNGVHKSVETSAGVEDIIGADELIDPDDADIDGEEESPSEKEFNAAHRKELAEISYNAEHGGNVVIVHIIGAMGLRDADTFLGQGASDPYCICEVLGKPENRTQTPHIMDNCNPVWNHEGTFTHMLSADSMVFTVWDKDPSVKKDDLLGTARLSAHQFFKHGGYSGALQLLDNRLRPSAGKLQVKIVVPNLSVTIDKGEVNAVAELLKQGRERWPTINPRGGDSSPTRSSAINDGLYAGEMGVHGSVVQDNHCLSPVVMHPFSKWRIAWDMSSLGVIGYDFFFIPFMTAFAVESTMRSHILGAMTTLFWFIDLILSFFTGFQHGGLIEMRPSKIAKHYVQTWFFMDFFLVSFDGLYFTFLILGSTQGSGQDFSGIFRIVKMAKAFRSVRILSLVRLSKLQNSVMKLWITLRSETFRIGVQIGGLLCFIVSLNHLISCGWYAMIHIPEVERSWVDDVRVMEEDHIWRYIYAMQWSFAQFTPSSTDIKAQNRYERVYQLCINFMGLVVFSSFVSTITQKMAAISRHRQNQNQQAADLRRFFSEKQISLHLSKCITDYVSQKKQEVGKHLDEKDIPFLAGLPEEVQAQLHVEMFMPTLMAFPFLSRLLAVDTECFNKLCHHGVKEHWFLEHSEVFAPRSAASSVYFFRRGDLNYHHNNDIRHLQDGTWAGEPSMWIRSWLTRGRLVSVSASDALMISVETWYDTVCVQQTAHSQRSRYYRYYASKYVREGAESLSDIGPPAVDLEGFADEAHGYACPGEPASPLSPRAGK